MDFSLPFDYNRAIAPCFLAKKLIHYFAFRSLKSSAILKQLREVTRFTGTSGPTNHKIKSETQPRTSQIAQANVYSKENIFSVQKQCSNCKET